MEKFCPFQFFILIIILHLLKSMFHTCVCNGILLLHLIWSPALNWKSGLDYICQRVFPFLLPIAVLSWSCCLVSEFVHLVGALAVDFLLAFPVPCRRDNQVPIHIYLLWDCLLPSVPPSGRECQCSPSYFAWLDNLSGEAIVYHQTSCLTFCQHLAMGCLVLLWVELHY